MVFLNLLVIFAILVVNFAHEGPHLIRHMEPKTWNIQHGDNKHENNEHGNREHGNMEHWDMGNIGTSIKFGANLGKILNVVSPVKFLCLSIGVCPENKI